MDSKGMFCWYELTTTDTRAAERFYRDVVGWTARDAGHPDMEYTQFLAGDVPAAGLMALSDEAKARGAKPAWVGSIAVADVDEMADKVVAAGGRLYRAPADIPGIGRFAVAADPQGVTFVLFRDHMGGTILPVVTGRGSIGWRELVADDGPAAFAFYSGLFGWTKAGEVDMGPMGLYHLFGVAGGAEIGGIMTKPPGVPSAFWTYYLMVDGIAAAMARVTSAEGTITNGPHQVPGGLWMVQGRDPQGATFALLSAQA